MLRFRIGSTISAYIVIFCIVQTCIYLDVFWLKRQRTKRRSICFAKFLLQKCFNSRIVKKDSRRCIEMSAILRRNLDCLDSTKHNPKHLELVLPVKALISPNFTLTPTGEGYWRSRNYFQHWRDLLAKPNFRQPVCGWVLDIVRRYSNFIIIDC